MGLRGLQICIDRLQLTMPVYKGAAMDYRVEALEILLNEDCILQRYYPLIPYKESLLENLKKINCSSKSECIALPDETLTALGLPSPELVSLFRRFLVMYDVRDSKFRDIDSIAANEAQAAAFRELYLLPGVKSTRALLYYDSGYSTLRKIASSLPEQILRDTGDLIARKGLTMKAPLPKEVRTHIAVAKALTEFAVS